MRSPPSPRPVLLRRPRHSAPTHGLPGLTARDAERVAAALEAELAASTRIVYASAWRQWEEWCAPRRHRPARTARGARRLPGRARRGRPHLREHRRRLLRPWRTDTASTGCADPTTDADAAAGTPRTAPHHRRRTTPPGTPARRHRAHPDRRRHRYRHTARRPGSRRHPARLRLRGAPRRARPHSSLADIATRPDGLLITDPSLQDRPGRLRAAWSASPGPSTANRPIRCAAVWDRDPRRRGRALFTRIHQSGAATVAPIGARTVSRMLQARAAEPPAWTASRSPGTRCAPATPPPPPPTAHRSPGSPPRPDTAISTPWSSTTSDPRRPGDLDQSRPRTLTSAGPLSWPPSNRPRATPSPLRSTLLGASRDARPLDSGAALGPQTNEKRQLLTEGGNPQIRCRSRARTALA